jgi:Tol biopolymer transport system component
MRSQVVEMRFTAILSTAALVAACGTEPSPPLPPLAGKIVFASDRGRLDGKPVLYSMNWDGTGIAPLSIALPGPLSLPSVNPDGRRVMFTRDGVYIADASGLNLNHVLTGQEGVGGRFDPTGDRMVFASAGTDGSDLSILDLKTRSVVKLTDTPGFSESQANWSPDGQWICYTRGPTDDSDPEQVWMIRADGSDATQLTFDPDAYSGDPAFSNAGDWIAYSRTQSVIRLIHPDGTDDHAIVEADPLIGSIIRPAWSPGDLAIALSYGARIVTVHPDGTGLQVLADSGANWDPTWGPALK